MGLGVTELLVIFLIVMVLFGWKNLPQLGDSLGKSIRNFKKAVSQDQAEIDVTPTKAPDLLEPGSTVQNKAPAAAERDPKKVT